MFRFKKKDTIPRGVCDLQKFSGHRAGPWSEPNVLSDTWIRKKGQNFEEKLPVCLYTYVACWDKEYCQGLSGNPFYEGLYLFMVMKIIFQRLAAQMTLFGFKGRSCWKPLVQWKSSQLPSS